MGKIIERKKKKGRPSLLDLQKRALREQQQQKPKNSHKFPNSIKTANSTPNSSRNYNSATPSPLRRSTRCNDPSPAAEDDEEEVELGKRRKKKLKVVVKWQKSEGNSSPSNSNGDDSEGENDDNAPSNNKKRRINSIGDGSAAGDSEKGEKSVSALNQATSVQEDSGPSTPLPDKKLLLFILDRLQKKDTHGVYSEPVDPEELPDYHEVIEHPMDFGTIRKKLSDGDYPDLEHFEKDVFLLCSNAMQYNAQDTIYFRQARSIQELAQKDFQNLRQDSDDSEPENKVVRRGRPPMTMKNLKKQLAGSLLNSAGSEFSSGATLTTVGKSNTQPNIGLKKGTYSSDKSGSADLSGRVHGVLNSAYCLTDNNFERNEENTGSIIRGNSARQWKKQTSYEGNRRSTYKPFHQFAVGESSSVLATFDSEMKQLIAVGLFSEYGYARSLARFATNIGPVAWTIASKRIDRSLPQGVKYGPGWVGENDIPSQRPSFPLFASNNTSSSCLFPYPLSSSDDASTCNAELEKDEMPQKPEDRSADRQVCMHSLASEGHLNHHLVPSTSTITSHFGASKSDRQAEGIDTAGEDITCSAYDTHESSTSARVPSSSQFHQNYEVQPDMNRLNMYGCTEQTGFIGGPGLNSQPFQMVNSVNVANANAVHQLNAHYGRSDSLNYMGNSGTISSISRFPDLGSNEMGVQGFRHKPQSSLQQATRQSVPLPKQLSITGPPDLNEEIQPGSPASSRVGLAQPDLVLTLGHLS